MFGLSDRYQYLLTYKIGSSGECIESIRKDLIPFAVDPKVDSEGLNSTQILNNLMYGADDYCRELTTYQRKVLLGYESIEEPYKKESVLVNDNDKLETVSSDKGGLVKFVSLFNKDLSNGKNVPIVGVETNGTAFSYNKIDSSSGGNKVDLNQLVLFNGEKPKDDITSKIDLLVFQTDDSPTPMGNSNSLGLSIFNMNYCDGRTINPIKANSAGH